MNSINTTNKSTDETAMPIANVLLSDVDYRHQLSVRVNGLLSSAFVAKVNLEDDCKIQNVFEIIKNELFEYWIICPKEKEEKIIDLAFMTFIKNPKFQKYYEQTQA